MKLKRRLLIDPIVAPICVYSFGTLAYTTGKSGVYTVHTWIVLSLLGALLLLCFLHLWVEYEAVANAWNRKTKFHFKAYDLTIDQVSERFSHLVEQIEKLLHEAGLEVEPVDTQKMKEFRDRMTSLAKYLSLGKWRIVILYGLEFPQWCNVEARDLLEQLSLFGATLKMRKYHGYESHWESNERLATRRSLAALALYYQTVAPDGGGDFNPHILWSLFEKLTPGAIVQYSPDGLSVTIDREAPFGVFETRLLRRASTFNGCNLLIENLFR